MTTRLPTGLIGLAAACAVAVACGGHEATPEGGDWRAERDTVGDTVVVRTTGGSVWGPDAKLVEDLRIGRIEGPPAVTFGRIAALTVSGRGKIYVADAQVPAVRVFSSEGEYLRTFGGQGEGPGEYMRPNSIAVLPDDRVVVRDPGTRRLNVYTPEGEYLEAWPQSRWFFAAPLVVDTSGHLYNSVVLSDESSSRTGLARYGPQGEVLDTLPAPSWDYEAPDVTGHTPAGNLRRSQVPFTATIHDAFSPLGYFVGGVATRYAVTLFRPKEPLQFQRSYEAVSVKPQEAADRRRHVVERISSMVPGWEWNGPPIPEVKAPYKDLFVGMRGRIWVQLHAPGKRLSERRPSGPGRAPPPRWVEPVVYDVFEPDGRYLGRLRPPEGFQVFPRPVARGDTLWAVVEDELDVQHVVRWVREAS